MCFVCLEKTIPTLYYMVVALTLFSPVSVHTFLLPMICVQWKSLPNSTGSTAVVRTVNSYYLLTFRDIVITVTHVWRKETEVNK